MSSQGGPGTEATASGKSNILRASKLSNFGSGSSGSPARSGPTTAAAETSASAVAAASPGAKKLFTALKVQRECLSSEHSSRAFLKKLWVT